MRRYWTRITLGALGIFALGMLVVSAGRKGVDHVKQLAAQQVVKLSHGVAPFQIDNRRLGTLTEVGMDPERSDRFPFINLTVELDPGIPAADLGDCTLLARDLESLEGDKGLHCDPGISRDSLVEMGLLTFEPSGETVGIYIAKSQLKDVPWFNQPSSEVPPSSEGSLSLQANAGGAFMLIKDEKGRPVFQLNADSSGAFIQIRDSNGKEVVRFHADSQGVKGRMNSN